MVVGAGLSGLSCATELTRHGVETLVLEKSRGLGGRCATWRVDGQPVDHGAPFYHGSDPDFLAALRGSRATVVEGWPNRVRGDGAPCQRGAFAMGERRLAFAEGMTAFPKHLGASLSIRRSTRVLGLVARGGSLEVRCESGVAVRADAVVLAVAAPQARPLLETLPSPPAGGEALLALHAGIATTACLTVMAGYASGETLPQWDLWQPEGSRILQTLIHDSAKRTLPRWAVLTLQAHAAWSREWFERDEADWTRALLDEAGRLCGDWAGRPVWTRGHRWKYARVTEDSALATPLLFRLPGGARLGLTGDALGAAGGVEGAWLAGRGIATRLLADPGGS